MTEEKDERDDELENLERGKMGKSLENKISLWLKEIGIYFERIFDSRSVGTITIKRPADFLAYKYPQFYYLECKSIQSHRLPFSHFNQMPKLLKLKKEEKIVSYFIIQYNKKNIYAIEVEILYNFCINNIKETKSLSDTKAAEIGTKLCSKDDLKMLLISTS